MPLDPLLLQRALELPSTAISYFLGREITAYAGGRAAIELPGNAIDLFEFAKKGRCEIAPREGIHSQLGRTWLRRGALEEAQGTSWFHVRWEGLSLIHI